jgi:2-isopropylmalate synthase
MHPEVGTVINRISDERGKELNPEEIYNVFNDTFINQKDPLELIKFNCTINKENNENTCNATVKFKGKEYIITGNGNGPIDAFVHGLKIEGWNDFKVTDFHEQSLGTGSDTEAISYMQITTAEGKEYWGAGIDTNISLAGIKSLINAFNRSINSNNIL